MTSVLVTGGCGFIGSHLCAALLARGYAVRVLDDLSTGWEENLAPGAELILGDVSDAAAVRAAVEGTDAVFHLAAIASVARGVEDWTGTHRTNLTGTIMVLDAARAGRLPVVYASSAAVYGDASPPIAEDAATRPLSAYGADKLGCELHARVAGVVHAVPTMGLRFFNVFGARQDPRSPYSGVISIFCDRLMRGERVTIHGDGRQTRDFVPVGTVVEALLRAVGAASTAAPVLNVCTGRATSVLDLAGTIADLLGTPGRLDRAPGRPGDIRHSLGSPSRVRNLLGLEDGPGLREGLADVLRWMRAGRPGIAGPAGFSPAC